MSRAEKSLSMLFAFAVLIGSRSVAQIGPVSFAPSGRTIAFSYSKEGSCFIYKADLTSGAATRLTSAKAGCESDPAFSKDGKMIAYSFSSPENPHSNLYLINADGTNPHLLLETDADDIQPVFAPDGRTLYFMRSLFFGHYSPIVRPRRHDLDLFVIDLKSKKVESITSSKFYEVAAPSLSPDSKHILFRAPGTRMGESEFRVYAVTDGRKPELSLQPHVPGEPRSGPILADGVYLSDGRTIIFQAASNGSPTFNYDIYRMSAGGGEPEALTHGIGYASGVRPSPDGKTAMFLKWDVEKNTNELYLLDLTSQKVSRFNLSGID
jgi:Tol biopolymer transport system component